MKRTYIYLTLTGYLREWLVGTMGNPLSFPPRSYENMIIAHYLSRLPSGSPPQLPTPDSVTIIAPVVHCKTAEEFNYFGRRGKVALTAAIEMLFVADMWVSLASHIGCENINNVVDKWCACRGITLTHREAVRQKFYRLRRSYEKNGIYLGKKYRKNH